MELTDTELFQQEMEAEAQDSREAHRCIACLESRPLDADGLCATCDPDSPETRTALLNLLQEPYMEDLSEVETSENK